MTSCKDAQTAMWFSSWPFLRYGAAEYICGFSDLIGLATITLAAKTAVAAYCCLLLDTQSRHTCVCMLQQQRLPQVQAD